MGLLSKLRGITADMPKALSRGAFVCVMLLAMIGQGAFSVFWCLGLDLLFLLYLMLCRQRVKMDAIAALLAALPVFAAVSSLLNAANAYAALCEIAKYLIYPLSYLALRSFADRRFIETVLYRITVFLGAAGLLAMLGWEVMPGMVIAGSMRLQSFLQYANTTAVLLGWGIFVCAARFWETRNLAYSLPLAILTAALLLTKSRIVFWVFLLVLVLFCFDKLGTRGRIVFAAAAGVALVLLAVLGNRLFRISLFEPTLVERFITYADALRLLAGHPMGIGAGAWQYEQLLAQSAPYYVKYIHSAFFQIALDAGIVGLGAFLAVAGLALRRGFRRRGTAFYGLLLLLLSSLLDAHLSFGLVIVFFTQAVDAVCGAPEEGVAAGGSVRVSARKKNARIARKDSASPVSEVSPSVLFPPRRRVRWLMGVPACLLLAFLLSEALVLAGHMGFGGGLVAYRTAQAINPANYTVFMQMAEVEKNRSAALSYLEEGYAANPDDWRFALELSKGWSYAGDDERAIAYARRYFETHRYSAVSQRNFSEILDIARGREGISQERYDSELAQLARDVENANAEINPWYRYINSENLYS